MIRLLILLGFLWAAPAVAQNVTCATRPASDNSNACASTAFVQTAVSSSGTALIQGTPSAGQLTDWFDATHVQGITTGTGVLTALGINIGSAGAFITFNGAAGTPSSLVLTNATGLPIGGITGLGTGVATALAANTASAANVKTGTSTTNLVTPAALSGSAAAQTLTDGATINWNMASGYNAKITLTASGHTFAAPTNVIEGLTYTLQLDVGAGPYTVNWNAAFNWGAAGTPTISAVASDVDVISCLARATNNLLCTINKGF